MGWCLYCKCMIQPKQKIHPLPLFGSDRLLFQHMLKLCIQAALMCHTAIFIPSQEIVQWRNDEQHNITELNFSTQWLQWWISIFFMHGSHSHGKHCNVLISRSKKSHGNFFSEDNYYFIHVISTWHADGNPSSNLANTVYVFFWSQWMFLLHIQKNCDFFSLTFTVRCFEFQMLQIRFPVQCGEVHAFTFGNAVTYLCDITMEPKVWEHHS